MANLISGMRTIQNLEKHRTRASFRVLALSPFVFGSQFVFFSGGGVGGGGGICRPFDLSLDSGKDFN